MNEWMNKQELGFGLHNCFRNTHIQWLKISRVTPRNIHFNRLPGWFLISPLNTSFAEWAEIRYWQWEWSRREKFGKGGFFYLVCTFLLAIILPLFVYGQQDLCNHSYFSVQALPFSMTWSCTLQMLQVLLFFLSVIWQS